jgi:DNA (cytosine-5)-methyltransferase 1
MEELKFIDLFCGIGGFRQAMDDACRENDLIPNCVFSSDIDDACRYSYEANFGEYPAGDITRIDEKDGASDYRRKAKHLNLKTAV